MQKVIALSQERFFLYWNNHLQPVAHKEQVKDYIKNSLMMGGRIEQFKLCSNYSERIDINEFLNS